LPDVVRTIRRERAFDRTVLLMAVRRFLRFMKTVGHLALPYFRSEERWSARLLLAAVVGVELGLVVVAVLINRWNAAFYNALQDRDWHAFVIQLQVFGLLAAVQIGAMVYQQYLTQWLTIRWRRWMTVRLVDRYLDGPTHYRMQIAEKVTDNPDQRIAEDVRIFITSTLGLGVNFLGNLVSLFSFVTILWTLSSAVPLMVGGVDLAVPGYLVWAALAYAAFGTLMAHAVGKKLIPLNFEQQRREADFRFQLVRLRENSESIAFLKGEDAERRALGDRFGAVAGNFHQLMNRQKLLTLVTAAYSQASVIFPYVAVAPLYFGGIMQLGVMMQTVSAFGQVRAAFSFFVTSYPSIADWAAVVQRLAGFEAAMLAADGAASALRRGTGTQLLAVTGLEASAPGMTAVLGRLADLAVAPGERVLLSGPSGAGKTSLFRALGGIWPFATGHVEEGARRPHFVPQRSYFPLGTLRDALAYPRSGKGLSDAAAAGALAAVGLGALGPKLDAAEPWSQRLSGGEQQRLALARALLFEPDLLFLDEATSALDEEAEIELHRALRAWLPETAIISVAHRASLAEEHDRTVCVERVAAAPPLTEGTVPASAR
jgi:putative ATP-binding cassette transporter